MHEAFLTAIRETPEDDTPRLIFADWLKENGDTERAEFIRLECRIRALPPDDPDYLDLFLRATDLQTLLEPRLLAEWPALTNVEWQPVFERGFLSHAAIDLGDFQGERVKDASYLPILDEIVSRTPVRHLYLSLSDVYPDQFLQFLQSPAVASLTGLSLSLPHLTADSFGVEFIRVLASAPQVRNLRQLNCFLALNDTGLALLAQSPHLGNLTAFSAWIQASPDGIRTLAGAPWWNRLHQLNLRSTNWPVAWPEGPGRFAPVPSPAHAHAKQTNHAWRRGRPEPGAPLVNALARTMAFPRLARLDLGAVPLGPEGLAVLARAGAGG